MAIVGRCLLVLGLLAALPALAQQEPQQEPPGRVGRVGIISGTLAFYGPGDSEWSAAPVNLPVATGGWFATDPRSRAQLRVGPDTVNLAEETQLNIADLRDGVMQLALTQGRIGLQLHRPAWRKDQTAEIDIARGGVWLLQPGDYDIDAGTPDRPTRISVFDGSARFVGGGVDKVVKAGERLVLTGADPLTAAIERAEPDDFANWCRDHGIRQDRVAAMRRVSPAMTGFEELEEYGQWAEAADYGAVWYPKSVPADWAPYRAGRWVWVEPWGWNWVDDQPWGFAPFHYGRWALVDARWAWVPGEFVAQPVYAPALVAFLPQPAVEIALAADVGPPVGWFPLAPGEVYWPSYTRSPTYIRNVNITNVRINVINQVTTALLTRRGTAEPPPLVLNQRFANRPAATIVPAQVVMRSAPVAPAAVRVPDRELRQTRVAALPPPAVARPAVAAAIAPATMARQGRQPSAGAQTAAPAPPHPHQPARPNFAQLAHAPRLGHAAAAAIPAALPGGAAAHKPGEAPAATAVLPPVGPHQPPAAANAAPPASSGPPGRPDFANLPRWRPHDARQQAQSGVPTPNASLPVPPSADPAARQHAAQELAQQRAAAAATARQQQADQRAARQQEMAARLAQQRTAGEVARHQQVEQRAAQQQATAEQRALREQARAAQLAQQRAAAEAAGHRQTQQRIAQQQALAEQRAAREQARAAQLGQQRAAAEAARGQLNEQRAGQQQAITAQQAQQRAAAEAARQHQAQQRAAQQQAMAAQQAQQRAAQQDAAQQAAAQRAAQQQAAAQRAAQQQAMAAQQAQQRAAQQQAVAAQQAQQRAAQQAAAQQAAAQRAAQQQAAAAQQAAAQQAAAQRAVQQQAMAAQQAQQRAAQQAAAQQAAAQRAAQQQAMAAQQAQQRAAQQAAQQQKGQQKQAHACGNPGQPACPQH